MEATVSEVTEDILRENTKKDYVAEETNNYFLVKQSPTRPKKWDRTRILFDNDI